MNDANMLIMIYFITIAVYGVAEIILQLWFSNWKIKKSDRSLLSIMLPFYLSIYLAPVENILIKQRFFETLIIIGFTVLIFGVFLRIYALLTLKHNFSLIVESGQTSSLIKKGLYKYIRHPLYLAVLVISISGCIIFSCYFTWIFVILTIIAVLKRIRKEESFLITQYSEYSVYIKTTYRLIPFVY